MLWKRQQSDPHNGADGYTETAAASRTFWIGWLHVRRVPASRRNLRPRHRDDVKTLDPRKVTRVAGVDG